MPMKKQQGFTLVEMLAALLILALCSTLLLQGFLASRHTLNAAGQASRLALVARSVLADQRARPLRPGVTQGRWDGDIRWQLRVTPQAGGEGVQLLRLAITVRQGRYTQHYSTLDLVSTRGAP